MSELLKLRNKRKKAKPYFEMQQATTYKDFRDKWRKPTGIHSKMRNGFRGHRNMPSVGYRSPNEVRGLTHKGLMPLVVSNLNDLSKVTKENVIVIAHGVGARKRLSIVAKAKEMKVSLSGIKDADAYTTTLTEEFKNRKKHSESRKANRNKRMQEADSKEKKEAAKKAEKTTEKKTASEKPVKENKTEEKKHESKK
jgi:large subunit ribosomal protein L32e